MTDEQETALIAAVTQLACTLRDEGPDAVRQASLAVLDAAGSDPITALCVAGALIRVDEPIDRWWERGLAGVGVPRRTELEIVA